MGSRARIAAAACLVLSGVLAAGGGAPTAAADPGQVTSEDAVADRAGPARPAREPRPSEGPAHPAGTADGVKDDKAAPDPDVDDAPGEPPPDEKPVEQLPIEQLPVKDEVPVTSADGPEAEWPRPPCCQGGGEDCGPGWPWPWPPPDPAEPQPDDNDPPNNDPPNNTPPNTPMSPPAAPIPSGVGAGGAIDVVPGIAIAADAAETPINIPIVIAAPAGAGPVPGPIAGPAAATGGGAGPGAGGTSGVSAAPRQAGAVPPRSPQQLPAAAGNSVAMPASASRVGYGEYLRGAGLSQIAALALPGLAGILVLTGAGGLVGYRQAKAGRGVRTRGIARFMN